MTDPTDHLLARLRSADPVDPTTLPTSTSPAARQLLDAVMASDTADGTLAAAAATPTAANTPTPTPTTATGIAAADSPVRSLAPPAVNRRPRRSFGGRGGALVATAAAVAVGVAGAVVLTPAGTDPALAAVQGAAAETAAVESGRVTTLLTMEGSAVDGDESGQATLEIAFAGDDASFTLDVAASDPALADDFDQSEARLVDDVLYVNDQGEGWTSMEVGGVFADTVVDYLDPRSVLDQVNQLTTAEEIGATTIDGLAVTHYRGVVDLAGQSMADWVAGIDPGAAPAQVEGEATLDIYIDGDGLLRHLDVTGEAQDPEGPENVAFTITWIFRDLGTDITIDVPAGATPLAGGDLPLSQD